MNLKQAVIAGLYIFVSGLSISCSPKTPISEASLPDKNLSAFPSEKITIQNNFTKKIKFLEKNGTEVFSLIPKKNGLKLQGSQGQTIVHLIANVEGKIQMQTGAGSILGHILSKSNQWQIEDGEETRILYTLRSQNDGGYIFESADNRPIYQITKQDDGWKIETPQAEAIYTIKMQGDRPVLEDAERNIVLQTDADFSSLAMACYGFNVLDLTQQTALAYAVSLGEKVD